MASRCRMPSEYRPTGWSATAASPTVCSARSAAASGTPMAAVQASRCRRAVRAGWKPRASSTAPTTVAGRRSAA